ncbi:MAG: tetratricopeptide repeat protein [Bacteroidetes bacterium]|nr:tetratricopeptide repeat protein [Bacteroidota bacterium]
MARRKKKTKKDETLVDIVEAKEQAQDFMESNQNLIFGALFALVLIIGGVFAYNNFFRKPLQKEAVEQMFQAQYQFERDSFALALTNPGGGFSGFLDIIDNYKGTSAANLSLYYAGLSYLHLGQYSAALDYLKDYKPSGQVIPIMKYGAIGDAYSELNELDNAMKFYKKAINEGENETITAYYLKKVGMLHEKQGNFADAKDAYEKIKNEYPESPDGRDIDKFITRVASKG